MNKKGMTITEALLALILLVIVVLVVISYSPKIQQLIKIGVGFGEIQTNNINTQQSPTEKTEDDVMGKLDSVLIIKKEDLSAQLKPTSLDYCLVGTFVSNTGKRAWTSNDKIKIALFCNQVKDQIKETIQVQKYPVFEDYITDLKPGEQKEVFFADKFQNNCLESLETYYIILYSNCEGKGTKYQACDNFGTDITKNPKKLHEFKFNCKVD